MVKRLDEVEKITATVNDRLDSMNDTIQGNFNACSANLTTMETNLNKMECRLQDIERDSKKRLLRIVGLPLPTDCDNISQQKKSSLPAVLSVI